VLIEKPLFKSILIKEFLIYKCCCFAYFLLKKFIFYFFTFFCLPIAIGTKETNLPAGRQEVKAS